MNKTCLSCSKEFTITSHHRELLDTLDVPDPTLCTSCRFQRRLTFRNERYLYSRKCDKCSKDILSIYSSDKPYTVYCLDCWWSDDWDPASYGKDVDFTKPFFEQFHELRLTVPRIALVNDMRSENSDYTNHVYRLKNCYMVFDAIDNEGCIHSTGVYDCRDVTDCSYVDNSELCYETLYSDECYDIRYSRDCINSRNSAFLLDCVGVSNSLMCVGLRNKEYCYKNEQLSKKEYEKVLAKYTLNTRSGVERAQKEFNEFSTTIPRKYFHGVKNEKSSGDYLLSNNYVENSFQIRASENCLYCYGVHHAKDSLDYTVWGEVERAYESQATGNGSNFYFCNIVWDGSDAYYSDNCLQGPKNVFGCVGLKNQKYSILNKEYSPEEYEQLKAKLIEHMKSTGEWGEFLPSELSPFGYNETMAQEFYPLTKNDAQDSGWNWQDTMPGTFGKETLTEIPDSILETTDGIVKEVLACVSCKRNYRITTAELKFYTQQHIPVPDRCPDCRHTARTHYRSSYELIECQCMCDVAEHNNHNGRCLAIFQTAYSKDAPEIVYCEDCYKKETY